MKKLLQIVFVLFNLLQVNAQEKNIFTKTVKIDDFIPFIIEEYKASLDSVSIKKNITFLIPISNLDEISENSIILRQSFKLLSDRLSEEDKISIIAYVDIHGEVLNSISPKKIKTILYALNNIEQSISEKYEDGIQLGYEIADANFEEDAINSIVMIRDLNPETKKKTSKKKNKKPKKNKVVLLTLISLAPEVIKILKD